MKIQLLALTIGAALLAGCDQGANQGGVGDEDIGVQYGTDQTVTTNGTGGALDQDLGMPQGQGAMDTNGTPQSTPGTLDQGGASTPGGVYQGSQQGQPTNQSGVQQ